MKDKVRVKKSDKERLQDICLRYHLTIKELAEMSKLSTQTFYQIKSGNRFFTETVAAKVADALWQRDGVRLSRHWLTTGDGRMLETDTYDFFSASEEESMDAVAENEGEVHNAANTDQEDYKELYLQLLRKYVEVQEKYTSLMESLRG